MGVPQHGWFILENKTKMDDDWGYPCDSGNLHLESGVFWMFRSGQMPGPLKSQEMAGKLQRSPGMMFVLKVGIFIVLLEAKRRCVKPTVSLGRWYSHGGSSTSMSVFPRASESFMDLMDQIQSATWNLMNTFRQIPETLQTKPYDSHLPLFKQQRETGQPQLSARSGEGCWSPGPGTLHSWASRRDAMRGSDVVKLRLRRLPPTLTSVMITSQNPTRCGFMTFLGQYKLILGLSESGLLTGNSSGPRFGWTRVNWAGLMQAATKKLKTADGTAWEGTELWNPYGSSSLTTPMKSSCSKEM